MKVIFMGTPAFALPSLRGLAGSHHEVLAVITQPDRPKGRSKHPSPPPVKGLAQELGLKIIQSPNVNDPAFIKELKALSPEIVIVVAFGQKLSPEVLALPRFGCINLHASLLPRYRGAAPVTWAIVRGEEETGVTAMRITEEMDAGDILSQEFVAVGPEETAGELEGRLSEVAAGLLLRVLEAFELSSVYYLPQSALGGKELVSLAPRLKKGHGLINWAQGAKKVHDFIRGMNPKPGAYSYLPSPDSQSKRRIIILRSRLKIKEGTASASPPGTILNATDEGIEVATNGTSVLITLLQPEGSRAMTAREYLRGHSLPIGLRFVSA